MNIRPMSTPRACAVYLALALLALASFATATASAQPLFPQCPPVGNNQGCSQLIVINPNSAIVVKVDPAAPASGYDGSEDTLIGLQNNSPRSVPAVDVASTTDIFGFDGDGVCNPLAWPSAPAVTPSNCPGTQGFGSTGYEGPNTTFFNLSANVQTGVVRFTTPIPPGGSAYWALEEALTPGQLLSGSAGHPITTNPVVVGHSVSFELVCVGASGCNGFAQLVIIEHLRGSARIARVRTRKVVVGSVRVSVSGGDAAVVRVSLSKKGLALLKTVRSLPATVRVSLRSASGLSTATKVGKVTFKGGRHH
jgi:hypothetical protein